MIVMIIIFGTIIPIYTLLNLILMRRYCKLSMYLLGVHVHLMGFASSRLGIGVEI